MGTAARKSKKRSNKAPVSGRVIRDYEVAIKSCGGQGVTEIARDLGCTRATVYLALTKDRVKDYIEQHTLKIFENLPQAVKNVATLVDGMGSAETNDERKLCYQATRDVLTTANVLPSQSQTTLVQNVYNQQNNLIMSPIIREMIDKHNRLMNFDSVEVEGRTDPGGMDSGTEEVREAQEG